ncbi:O-antigen ligase [Rhodococcus sp. LW-XY12]|uniref:O-antigen ligase family protein n=1 Tax=Rhodococcus sp. LW-XY12 TaxID=2856851 RepID=UPI001C594D52|nr:O-antigen ligase family protein [Rhodococcus sp. LW-XY12]QXU53011.1 O-antigen ligase family protein [Rhodococcus sp. LW-XY12]
MANPITMIPTGPRLLLVLGVVLVGFAGALATYAPVWILLLCTGVLGLIWVLRSNPAHTPPRWLVAFIVVLVFGELLPNASGIVIQMLALVGGFVYWVTRPKEERRGGRVVFWALTIVAFWAVLSLHPNIPSAMVGVQGFAKSALAVAGVAWGCAIPSQQRDRMEKIIVGAVSAGILVSIVAHYWIPQISDLASRRADVYTGMLLGNERMQGIFAGPFHVAIAGLFLISWALVRYRTWPRLALLIGAVGLVGGYLSLVRTAYVALALVLLVYVVIAGSFAASTRRIAIALLAGTAGVAIFSMFPAAQSLGGVAGTLVDFQNDSRFLNRLPGYGRALEMVGESPFVGWGAGSAGDTLGTEFPPGFTHVTAHNLVLKIAVEGGLVGIVLWVCLIVAVFGAITWGSERAQVAVLCLVAMFGLGLTGSAIEAAPISFFIFFMVGLACRSSEQKIDFAPSQVSKSTNADQSILTR